MPGSDNIFTDIDPKESFTYEFKVPSSHMGGMHFYHPHKHGASTIQAGGGAAGAPLQTETLALS
jgi:FtsP/CotA-like multicopper oxidase with cupredoxin domain